MIIVASQRSGAVALADHLMNMRDNDHVEVIEIDGFMAEDLHGVFKEAQAISKATQCQQFLFSVSLNPPEQEIVSDDDFKEAADRVAKAVGLTGQPRAIVVHEKNGRRHAHAVWSRINVEQMKAVPLPHFKTKLRDVARELHLDHGWVLPDGLATYGNANPLNFTLEQWQQALRQGHDPREIKQIFRQAWERSDSLNGYKAALEERGFYLAKGDRRGFVALDPQGNIYAAGRWSGAKAKEMKAKLGPPDGLRSVAETQVYLRSRMTQQVKGYITEVKDRHADELEPHIEARAAMVEAQQAERKDLKDKQEKRWMAATKVRSDRLNTGLRGLFDRLTGKAKKIRAENEREAVQHAKRDQDQKDDLILAQMRDRQGLQKDMRVTRDRHKEERKILARNITDYLRRSPPDKDRAQEIQREQERTRHRSRGWDLSP